jgi:hypothetical protein
MVASSIGEGGTVAYGAHIITIHENPMDWVIKDRFVSEQSALF